jgi:transcriptional regulator with XRE-family HTH domain
MSRTKTGEGFKRLFAKTRKHLAYFVQGAITEFTESLVARMEETNITKTELAHRLKCEPSYITKVLRGGTNFTLETMVKLAVALNSELRVTLGPKVASEKISDILQNIPVSKSQPRSINLAGARQNLIQFPVAPARPHSLQDELSIAA